MSPIDDMTQSNESDEDTPFQARKAKNRLLLSDSEEDNASLDKTFTGTTNNDDVDSENEENESDSSKPKVNKKKKRIIRVESDSEDETTTQEKTKDSESSAEESSLISKNDRTDKLKVNDSDSASDEDVVHSKRIVPSKQKFKDILFNKLHKKKSKDVPKKINTKKKSKGNHNGSDDSSLSDTEENSYNKGHQNESDDSALSDAGKNSDNKIPENHFTNKDLYDAESSEEERANVSPDETPVEAPGKGKNKVKTKKKPHEKPAQRKSSAEALEKIHAETQRLIRESNVSLPYFLPKPTSISEFLQRRKPIPAIPLRAKGESLGSYINLYEERVKSITETFQHMSEDEEEEEKKNDVDTTDVNKENVTNNANGSKDSEVTVEKNVGETAENSSNLKEALTELDKIKENNCESSDITSDMGDTTSDTKEKDQSDSKIVNNTTEAENNVNSENKKMQSNSLDENLVENAEILPNIDNSEGEKKSSNLINVTDPSSNEHISSMSISQETPNSSLDDATNENQQKARDDQQTLNYYPKESKKSQPTMSETQEKLNNNQQRLNDNEEILYDNEKILNDNQQKLNENQQRLDNNQKVLGESQHKASESQQNSECNIFSSLTDTELMEEAEYTEDMCDDLDAVAHQVSGATKQSNESRPPVVKKKLFSDYITSMDKASGNGEDTLLRRQVTLRPASDGEDDFIELDDMTVKPAHTNLKPGVLKLMERFSKHVSTKPPKPKAGGQTVSINITTMERDSQGEITGYSNEALSIVLQDDPSLAMSKQKGDSKPGAKLVRLKEELDREMARKREESWKRRIEEAKMDEETYEGEKSECGDNEEFDDEENDLEDITTEEDEEEEDIREKPKKKRVKSDFVDEEAEVSEEDGGAEDEDESEEEEEEGGDREKDSEGKEDNELSGDEKSNNLEEESPRSLKTKTKTFDMFSSQRNDDAMDCDDDEELPAYQLGLRSTACTPAPDKVVFSPVLTLTVGKNQDASFLLDTSQNAPSLPSSPHLHHKKLNFDQLETEPADSGLEQPSGLGTLLPTQRGTDLEGLFSGQFTSQPLLPEHLEANDDQGRFDTQTQPVPQGVAELLGNGTSSSLLSGLCSGAFSSQPLDPKQLEENDGTCDRFMTTLSTAGTEEVAGDETRQDETHKLLLNKSSILSSDDEDEALDTSMTRRKSVKAPKRLVYSDDEEGSDEETGKEEDVTEEAKEEEGGEVEGESETEGDGEADDVEYDSEENEVVAKKVDEFFEAEAELSESEWGSEDEDEKEMDRMEMEEADQEYHDQDKLKEELGKIHMKQVLDDDNREVRMLQEILLEDGELHSEGPGRQRQFKWSNIDDNSDLKMTANLSGDSEPDEEAGEGEEQVDEAWRKARLDRELYLESQKDKLELAESIQEESTHHADLAKTVILNDIKTKPARPEPRVVSGTSELPTKSPDSKLHALMGLHKKRGSYLGRGNHSLVRLAKITSNMADDTDSKVLLKKKGNFVFSALEAPDPTVEPLPALSRPESPKPSSKVQIKRKKSLATPPLLKKLKMHDGSKSSVLSKLMRASDF